MSNAEKPKWVHYQITESGCVVGGGGGRVDAAAPSWPSGVVISLSNDAVFGFGRGGGSANPPLHVVNSGGFVGGAGLVGVRAAALEMQSADDAGQNIPELNRFMRGECVGLPAEPGVANVKHAPYGLAIRLPRWAWKCLDVARYFWAYLGKTLKPFNAGSKDQLFKFRRGKR